MERFEIKWTKEQRLALLKLAKGKPLNEMIRRAIDEYIEREQKKVNR